MNREDWERVEELADQASGMDTSLVGGLGMGLLARAILEIKRRLDEEDEYQREQAEMPPQRDEP